MIPEKKPEPKDELTYVFMLERIREDLHNKKIKLVAQEIGVSYRALRLIVNDPNYNAKIDVVSDIYKRLFNW